MSKAKGSPKTGGRRPGSINRATADARQAIAAFVDSNAHRLTGWLDQVADGVPDTSEDGAGKYIVKPDPARAFDLFQTVIEYHIPKLARTELTGKDGADLFAKIERTVKDPAKWQQTLPVVAEMYELADNWPGIAYTEVLDARVKTALG